ncbi:g8300 [Coccomyxa viridis]|uniref:G8300 protein n=1 Tax=Coccomyxa viridis TaxID=1274662 RepID=A0ABP1G4V7_9CHLO
MPRSRSIACSQASYIAIESIRQIPDTYKAVLLDQFGVLHDGQKPYPGSIEAVKALAESGRKILIISNSSRRSSGALGKLEKMGFPKDAFFGAITSGEVCHQALQNRPDDFYRSLGKRCVHITWGARGAISLGDLDVEVVESIDEAEFLLAHGTECLGSAGDAEPREASLDEIRAVLEQGAKRDLPLLIANPDIVTVSGSGLIVMPGTFGRWYKEMGGQVVLLGKPASAIYEVALEMLEVQDPKQVLAIGDSMEHDIAGAQAAGCDSLFVAGGIHAEEAGVQQNQQEMKREGMEKLFSEHSTEPTFAISYLQC